MFPIPARDMRRDLAGRDLRGEIGDLPLIRRELELSVRLRHYGYV
jgi:hypothetical protein